MSRWRNDERVMQSMVIISEDTFTYPSAEMVLHVSSNLTDSCDRVIFMKRLIMVN